MFSRHLFKWQFIRAAILFPILGVDFLQAFSLLVDAGGRWMVSTSTGEALLLAACSSGPTAAMLLPGGVTTCSEPHLSSFIAKKAVRGGGH